MKTRTLRKRSIAVASPFSHQFGEAKITVSATRDFPVIYSIALLCAKWHVTELLLGAGHACIQLVDA